MGLQVPLGVDHEVPVSGVGGRCRRANAGTPQGDSAKSGDDDLCWGDQPRPRAHADLDTAPHIGVQGGAVSEGEEFAPAVVGVSRCEEAVLGATFVGARLLGSEQRQCNGRSVEEIHRGSEARDAR